MVEPSWKAAWGVRSPSRILFTRLRSFRLRGPHLAFQKIRGPYSRSRGQVRWDAPGGVHNEMAESIEPESEGSFRVALKEEQTFAAGSLM